MDEQELIKKYGLDIEALKREQLKLAKEITLKDAVDFSFAERFGAVESIIIDNKIISVVIVCDKEGEILDQQYFLDKLRFPYLSEFRSYRELPSTLNAFYKLSEKPDVVFIKGHGITHSRLGLASHFGVLANVPTIGIADSLFDCDKIKGENIMKNKEIAGRVLHSKEKSNPLFVSVGNGISLETAYELTKSLIKSPHKLPEPLSLAHKYAKSVREELRL